MITDERLHELRAAVDETPAEDRDTADNAIDELLNEIARARQAFLPNLLSVRGVAMACTKCGGAGTRVYGSSATWRGGIGGQSLTTDVCDHCWGSGDEHRHWQSWRKQEENAQTLLDIVNALIVAGKISGTLPPTRLSLTNAVKDLIDVCEKARQA